MSVIAQDKWFRVEAADGESGAVEVFLYDELFDSGCEFWGGVCPQPFIEALSPYRDREITVRINSPGGSAFAGLALFNYLQTLPRVSTVVDSVAASAASIVLLAAPAERRAMARTAFVMIHEASGMAIGPAEVMEKMADNLRLITDSMVALYARETGGDKETIAKQVNDETWLDAEAALKAGFVSKLVDGPQITASAHSLLGKYRRTPAHLRPKPEQLSLNMNATLGAAAPVSNCGCGGAPMPAPKATDNKELEDLKAENEKLRKDLEDLKATDESAKKARAKAAVKAAIADGRLQPALEGVVVDQYMRDESATLDMLAKLTPAKLGTEPVQRGGTSDGRSAREIMEAQVSAIEDPRKRHETRMANWRKLYPESLLINGQ